MTLMTAEEKRLLTKASKLMDELLETLDITRNKKLARDLRASLKEVKQGKTKPLEELKRELCLED